MKGIKVQPFMHEQAGNAECFKKEGSFDPGLQVSRSETFFYVAFPLCERLLRVQYGDHFAEYRYAGQGNLS